MSFEEFGDVLAGRKMPRQRLDRLEEIVADLARAFQETDSWLRPEVEQLVVEIRAELAAMREP